MYVSRLIRTREKQASYPQQITYPMTAEMCIGFGWSELLCQVPWTKLTSPYFTKVICIPYPKQQIYLRWLSVVFIRKFYFWLPDMCDAIQFFFFATLTSLAIWPHENVWFSHPRHYGKVLKCRVCASHSGLIRKFTVWTSAVNVSVRESFWHWFPQVPLKRYTYLGTPLVSVYN